MELYLFTLDVTNRLNEMWPSLNPCFDYAEKFCPSAQNYIPYTDLLINYAFINV